MSLFSYFSSRKRFGVVANSNKRIKDLYLIPLSSKDPLPAKLLPFDGPGKLLQDDDECLKVQGGGLKVFIKNTDVVESSGKYGYSPL